MTGKCFLVATPIGNLKDITLRALETLKEADIIACEDTRHTKKLLNHYSISKPLISYHQHKEQEGSEQIIGLLNEGKNIALVSDAGMPCISDPGATLVNKLRENEISVTVIPGASAITSAVALSGIEDNFTFIGFLSEKKKDREELITIYKNIPSALVIYCSPHDLIKNLIFLYENLGERKVHIIKEITKIYEKVITGILGKIKLDNPPKGEYVIIVEKSVEKAFNIDDIDIKSELKNYMDTGFSKKEAIRYVCEKYKLNKNDVYPYSIGL